MHDHNEYSSKLQQSYDFHIRKFPDMNGVQNISCCSHKKEVVMNNPVKKYEAEFDQFSYRDGFYKFEAYNMSTVHICSLMKFTYFQKLGSILRSKSKEPTFIFSYAFRVFLTDYLIFERDSKILVGVMSFTPYFYKGFSLVNLRFLPESCLEALVVSIINLIQPYLGEPFSVMDSYQSIFYPHEHQSPFRNYARVEQLKGIVMVIRQNELTKINMLTRHGFYQTKKYSDKVLLKYDGRRRLK